MFEKLLIANRGEIACRVIRTCRRLGISTVAIYSEADALAPHVALADEAYCVGPAPAKESYLNADAVLQIAVDTGADALHPGYGFLSENAGFARACAAVGVTLVGPSPDVIDRMGDKVGARAAAVEAGLTLLPGSQDEVSDEEALAVAEGIGFPVMVKAAAGGGGIGMRVARSGKELGEVLKGSRSLAENAFGSGKVYLERFVEKAAHVEIQIFGDSQGHILHLNERDCSTQRRHQKVIEETPSPRLTEDLRSRMTEAALMLARHIGYTNAGTVEFIVDDEGRFYFLEVNTRLQVEHPVTEMVTGLDLVELQLVVASGEPLSIAQGDVHSQGHAIEARVYSEDPDTLFPTTGTISELLEPVGPHIRVDSGIAVGYEMSPYYDPMMAKLIVWGENRGEAVARLDQALRQYRLRGFKCNIPLMLDILAHQDFIGGSYTTSVVEAVAEERASRGGDDKQTAAAVAVSLALELRRRAAVQRTSSSGSNWKREGLRSLMASRQAWSR